MPAQLSYPKGQNAVVSYGDAANVVAGTYNSFPLPFAQVNVASTNKLTKFVTSSASFVTAGAKVGDYLWFYDSGATYYDCRQIVGFMNNNLTAVVDQSFEVDHSSQVCKIIRPLFCRVQVVIAPTGAGDIINVMGAPIICDTATGAVNLVWEKPADSHSAERNLLNPIIVDQSGNGFGKAIFIGTAY